MQDNFKDKWLWYFPSCLLAEWNHSCDSLRHPCLSFSHGKRKKIKRNKKIKIANKWRRGTGDRVRGRRDWFACHYFWSIKLHLSLSLLARLPPLTHLLPYGTLVVFRGEARHTASQPLLLNASILCLAVVCRPVNGELLYPCKLVFICRQSLFLLAEVFFTSPYSKVRSIFRWGERVATTVSQRCILLRGDISPATPDVRQVCICSARYIKEEWHRMRL